ncbi:MAG: hypothetical protein WAK31_04165 [Chthoniobacterales bacterium]
MLPSGRDLFRTFSIRNPLRGVLLRLGAVLQHSITPRGRFEDEDDDEDENEAPCELLVPIVDSDKKYGSRIGRDGTCPDVVFTRPLERRLVTPASLSGS